MVSGNIVAESTVRTSSASKPLPTGLIRTISPYHNIWMSSLEAFYISALPQRSAVIGSDKALTIL
jgi:hypothetical protein